MLGPYFFFLFFVGERRVGGALTVCWVDWVVEVIFGVVGGTDFVWGFSLVVFVAILCGVVLCGECQKVLLFIVGGKACVEPSTCSILIPEGPTQPKGVPKMKNHYDVRYVRSIAGVPRPGCQRVYAFSPAHAETVVRQMLPSKTLTIYCVLAV